MTLGILSIFNDFQRCFMFIAASITCSSPIAPTNGRIESTVQPTNGQLYQEGSTVRFACNSGYSLSGSEIVTCQGGGTWSANFPTCTGKSDKCFILGYNCVTLFSSKITIEFNDFQLFVTTLNVKKNNKYYVLDNIYIVLLITCSCNSNINYAL